jgi:hypothetical protein
VGPVYADLSLPEGVPLRGLADVSDAGGRFLRCGGTYADLVGAKGRSFPPLVPALSEEPVATFSTASAHDVLIFRETLQNVVLRTNIPIFQSKLNFHANI